MINRVGYTDNRTSFGSFFKFNRNYCTLYDVVVENGEKLASKSTGNTNKTRTILNTTIQALEDLRSSTPEHELELTSLSIGKDTKAVTVRNINTGSQMTYYYEGDLTELLLNLARRLVKNFNNPSEEPKQYKNFFNTETDAAYLHQIATGIREPKVRVSI